MEEMSYDSVVTNRVKIYSGVYGKGAAEELIALDLINTGRVFIQKNDIVLLEKIIAETTGHKNRDSILRSLLHCAVMWQRVSMIILLLRHGAKPTILIINKARDMGNLGVVKLLC